MDEGPNFGHGSVEDNDNDRNTFDCAPLPTRHKVSEMFSELESMCFEFNLPQSSIYLRRAKKEVEAEKITRSKTGKQR